MSNRSRIPKLVLLLAVIGLVIGAAPSTASPSAVTSHAGLGFALARSGPKGEGPYPWKYPGSGTVKVGTGKTIAGLACAAGAGQFDSPYAAPCIAKWSGSNGGATYNGVTGSTITLAMRTFPSTANYEEQVAVAKSEGIALPAVTDDVARVFLNYFNKVFDLYGRHVSLVEEHAVGNATNEALNEGQTQACADADTIANSLHAFGEVGFTLDPNGQGGGGTGPFSVCAAHDHLVEFQGGAYFPESWYEQYNPYVWALPMDCQRKAANGAQVYSQFLAGKKAIYAGDADLRDKVRKFGIYVPNLPQYIGCLDQVTHQMETKDHVPASAFDTVFTYNLDISTFEQSAQEAIVKFKAAGVTTIVTACDSFSLSLLTKAAAAQNYHPEWVLNGAASTDVDSVAQTYDQAEVQGHLFGQSLAPPQTNFYGPTSLAGKLYQKLTGHPIPPGTDGDYDQLVWIFDALQAAGPDLTPQNMARGIHALSVMGAPNYAYGQWNFNVGPSGKAGSGDHTAIDDAGWVYWNATGISPINGKPGTYVRMFDNDRFTAGGWPKRLPPMFSVRGSTDPTCNC